MRASVLIGLGLVLFSNSFADADDDDLPDLELLEFLAEWRSDGELIDPGLFEAGRSAPDQFSEEDETDVAD